MKKYINLILIVLVLIFILTNTSILFVSAEDAYMNPEKLLYGDVDLDGAITIKDATFIQKGLAKVTYVNAVQRCLADPEGTGYSIKNATAIQKYLAKYETSISWGDELVMESQNEFSKHITPNAEFLEDCIVIASFAKYNHRYTVEDFPEYRFKTIEIIGQYSSTSINYYILYLESSGENNVVEAIKALDYRANIDLISAGPNYIYNFS